MIFSKLFSLPSSEWIEQLVADLVLCGERVVLDRLDPAAVVLVEEYLNLLQRLPQLLRRELAMCERGR